MADRPAVAKALAARAEGHVRRSYSKGGTEKKDRR